MPSRTADEIVYRAATAADVAAITELIAHENHRPIDADELAWMLTSSPSIAAWQDDTLVGIFYSRKFAPDIVELRNTLVRAQAQGLGVGRAMVGHFEQAARQAGYRAMIGVNCRLHPGATKQSASTARNFWLHMGWSIVFATDGSAVVAKHL